MTDEIIVIGSGVSGITTALTLQLLGCETKIVSDKKPSDITDKNAHPTFASLFPAASVIPHSVHSEQLKTAFNHSQTLFYELRKFSFPGLATHHHFEIFEEDPGDLDYRNWMPNFRYLNDLDSDTIPQRKKSPKLHGWVFDCIFADWPLYFPALIETYQQCGGNIISHKIEQSDIETLSADTIVNCSGAGAPHLFDDPCDKQLIMRGHMLHKANAPLIKNKSEEIISYNYTPVASVYSNDSGTPCDVYFYPRKDGWIIGGSRQIAKLEQQQWPENNGEECYEINDITFPKQILDLNSDILQKTYEQSLDLADDLSISVGYRYIRNRDDGLRLEEEEISTKKVYHNYGHGGAGVTLSWGCAVEIAHKITDYTNKEIKEEISAKIREMDLNKLS